MTLTLKIDNREQKLITQLKDIEYTVCQLELGDIIISLDDNIIIIIERKTTNDLECSIKDGRYKEQKYRLSKLKDDNIIVMYLIEGTKKTKSSWSAQINTMIRDNLYVFRTYNIQETVEFLQTVMKNIPKFIDSFNKSNNDDTQQPIQSTDYINSVTIKKKQTCSKDIFCLQLQQISGISVTIAKCIQDIFPNWKELITNGTIENIKEIKYKCKTGKERSVGKVIGTRLFNYLQS